MATRFLRSLSRGYSYRPVTSRIGIILVIATIIAILAFWFGIKRAEPTIALIARTEAREYVIRAINEAVKSEIDGGKLVYKELVTLEKNDEGSVTALITDMTKINTLQARISNQIAMNVVNILNTDMAVHFGDVIGGVLFAGRGPKLPVRVQSVTDISTSFINDFSDSGINQTRHKIVLVISANIDILIPGGRTQANVTTEIAVAETIIVGSVPNVYARAG